MEENLFKDLFINHAGTDITILMKFDVVVNYNVKLILLSLVYQAYCTLSFVVINQKILRWGSYTRSYNILTSSEQDSANVVRNSNNF